MSKIKLTKKGITALIVLGVLIVGGATGFLLWRINNQEEEISPTESDASGCHDGRFGSVSECVTSCESGCGGSEYPQACIDGCPSACESLCKEPSTTDCTCDGTAISGTRCGSDNKEDRCQVDSAGNCNWADTSTPCGGDDDPDPDPDPGTTACSCESYSGCGTNCSFSGIDCQSKANSSGVAQIAMCYSTTNPTCDDYVSGHICFGITDQCGNPVWEPEEPEQPSYTCWQDCPTEGALCSDGTVCNNGKCRNVACPDESDCGCPKSEGDNYCEQGYLDLPEKDSEYTAGDTVKIAGWAGDPDGIDANSIDVYIDGEKVGNAQTFDVCENGKREDLCGNSDLSNPVAWEYDWTATEGTHSIYVTWKDAKGNTGDACKGSSSVIVSEPLVVEEAPLCESMSLSGGEDVGGTRYVQEDEVVSVTVVGSDPDGQPSKISICYSLDGMGADYYKGLDVWACSDSTELSASGESYSSTVGGLTFAAMKTALIAKGATDSQVDSQGIVFTTNIFDDSNGTYCSTNIGYNNGSGILAPDLTSGCDGDSCVSRIKKIMNPDWVISKRSVVTCLEKPDGMKARVDYDITVKNIGEGEGVLNEVSDLMPGIDVTWIITSSISPEGGVAEDYNGVVGIDASSSSITWNLSGETASFDVNESKTFSFTVIVPESAFGGYQNTAVGIPEIGDNFEVSHMTFINCDIIVPDTGLFDSTISKLILSGVLLVLSWIYISFEGVDRVMRFVYKLFSYKDKVNRNRRKFEEKVTKE